LDPIIHAPIKRRLLHFVDVIEKREILTSLTHGSSGLFTRAVIYALIRHLFSDPVETPPFPFIKRKKSKEPRSGDDGPEDNQGFSSEHISSSQEERDALSSTFQGGRRRTCQERAAAAARDEDDTEAEVISLATTSSSSEDEEENQPKRTFQKNRMPQVALQQTDNSTPTTPQLPPGMYG